MKCNRILKKNIKMVHHVAEQIHTLLKTILHLFWTGFIYSLLILKRNKFIEELLHPPGRTSKILAPTYGRKKNAHRVSYCTFQRSRI